jgi:hypothetical protein
MIDGTLLFANMTVYSPWFPRQADMLRVTAECIAYGGAELVVSLYTKNAEDTGDGLPVDEGVAITLDGVERTTEEWKTVALQEGVQQLLRFRYELADAENPNSWILFRLLSAVWFDAVSA